MDGTFPHATEDARAGRREDRLATLALMRGAMGLAVERLADGTAGRLPVDEQDAFERRPGDPYLAMSRLAREVCRVVMLEERLDEDAETRAKRIAEEQAERERRAQAAQQARERQDWIGPLMENKHIARDAVGRIYLDVNPDTTEMDLNRLLDPLLDEYEIVLDVDMDRAYGDAVQTVVRLCEELEIEVPAQENGETPDTPEAARTRLMELAERYIGMGQPANGNLAEEPVTALAQGPPG